MNSRDRSVLEQRLELRKSKYISERFEKSPGITEQCCVSDHLHIMYARRDESVLSLILESFFQAYTYVKGWFGLNEDMAFSFWMAPDVIDLRYMTCTPCAETHFCAPGDRNGRHVILFVSPLSLHINADLHRLSGLFAHEIVHHVVRHISGDSELSMKRKEERDVPMWLEEGLCQLMDSAVYPPLQERRTQRIAQTAEWCDGEDLWNDLSSGKDVNKAYLQA